MLNSPSAARAAGRRRTITRLTAALGAAVIVSGTTALAQAATGPAPRPLEAGRQQALAADLLDVDFAKGKAVDHSPRARKLVAGAAARIVEDAELDKHVSVGVEGAATAFTTPALSAADHAAMADGFSLETVVRVDSIAGSHVDLVSQGSGRLGLQAHRVAGTHQQFRLGVQAAGAQPAVALDYGQWYHLLTSWQGNQAILYVNGVRVGATAATVDQSDASDRRFVIGGGESGASSTKALNGRVSLARAYSAPATDRDAYRLARLGLPRLDTLEPVIKRSGTLPTSGAVGDVITFPGASATDDTGVAAEVVVTVTGPDQVVAAVSPNEDRRYSFRPAIAGAYTVAFTATDAAGNTGQESATITVTGKGDTSARKPATTSAAKQPATTAKKPTTTSADATSAPATAAVEPDIRFAAIGDIHNNWSELAEAYDFWEQQNVSTALFVGDITNTATASEFQGMKDTVDSKASYGIRLVASMGNHDVAAMSSYDLFTQSTGGQKPNADYLINGYHFITVSPGSGTLDPNTGKPSQSASNNYAYAASWVQQRLAADTAEDPTKPVFVLVHAPLQCTHYVSNEWYGTGLSSGCGVNLQSVFDAYPQAVVWSGHIHTPNNISSSIWQGQEGRSGTLATKGFTTVNAPSMAYFEFERGTISQNPTSRANDTTPDDAGNNRQTTVVEVTGSVVTIKNYDLLADEWINQTWTWNVAESVDTTKTYNQRFPLNSTYRASQTSAPVWPAGSAVTVSGISGDKAMVTFPQAVPAANSVQDIVHKYRYTTVDVLTGQTVNTFQQWSSFYKLPLPATKNHEVWGLTSGREYEVRVTPINTWGKEGAAITARFVAGGGTPTDPPFDPSTLTFDDLLAPIPVADQLDVAFQGGVAVDRSPKNRTMTAGADASVVTDAEVGTQVAVGREGLATAFKTPMWSDADYATLQDGFTVDATFRLDSINKGIGGYVDLFGGMEGAGIGLEAVKTSSTTSYSLEFWYANPLPVATLEYGKWYHVTGWYNGTDARLFVNGLQVAKTTNVSFNVKPTNSAGRYMTIGGDASSTGSLSNSTFTGRIAGASLSSAALSDKDVYRTAMKELTKLDEVPPMVRVLPAPPSSATVGTAYTAPAGQAVDNSGRVTLALEVTGPNGATVTTTPVSGGGYRFTPATAGAYTLRYTATDAAARQASADFTVNASAGGTTTPRNPIRNPSSNRCLDTTGGSSANGTTAVIYDCNASASQDWAYESGALVGKDGKCLDANGGSSADGTALIMWTCTGGANQKWTLNPNGSITGVAGKCVDVNAAGTANGTKVQLWTCNGAAAQKWAVALVNPASGRCLDAAATNGARVQISDCNRSAGQRWTLNGANGSIVGNAGRCLDASGGSSADGTAVIVWTCSGNTNQKWTLNADGTITGIGGKCLGTVANGTAAGSQLELRTCAGNASQRWVL